MGLNIVDVCWTMYRSNTTFDFVAFVSESYNRNKVALFFLNNGLIKALIVLIGRILGVDIYRWFYVLMLKGFTYDELYEASNNFYDLFLVRNKIDFTFNIIEKISCKKDIVLCSASLDIVIKVIAERLNFKYYASELEFVDGVCVGRLKKDLLGKKNEIFNGLSLSLVVTDNLTDIKLVKASECSFILSTQKNKKFWARHNIKVNYYF